jgi:hypothetical protein
MGHANNNFVNTRFNQGVKGYFKANNKRFAALNTKTLGCVEFIGKEILELICPDKSIIV